MYRSFEIKSNPEITKVYTAFSQTFGPEFKFRGETHDFWELVCVTEGQISVAADSRIFTLKKGQRLMTVRPYEEGEFAKPYRYRTKNLPSTGALLSAEDSGEQMSLL